MSTTDLDVRMHVDTLYRYPVKSMLGEAVDALFVDRQGVENDRRLALIDEATGRVASAKQAHLWRALLTCRASVDDGRVTIHLPDGSTVAAEAGVVDTRLSELLARQVQPAIAHKATNAAIQLPLGRTVRTRRLMPSRRGRPSSRSWGAFGHRIRVSHRRRD